MSKNLKRTLLLGLLTAVLIFIVKKCEQEPKIVVKTKIEYVTKTDTIIETIIKEKFVPRYIERVVTEKGKDSIIYVDKETPTAIVANEFDAVVKTDSSRADLKILTTGKLLDVKGTITYDQKETTTTITKIKPKSGLFLYGESTVKPLFEQAAIGLDYQFRNQLLLGVSGSYNNIAKKGYVNFKIGIRIL